MKDSELRAALAELRAAIEKLGPADTQARARLDALLLDLERKAQEPEDHEHHGTVIERLGDSIDHLRLEHPKATELLNRIMISLSDAGI